MPHATCGVRGRRAGRGESWGPETQRARYAQAFGSTTTVVFCRRVAARSWAVEWREPPFVKENAPDRRPPLDDRSSISNRPAETSVRRENIRHRHNASGDCPDEQRHGPTHNEWGLRSLLCGGRRGATLRCPKCPITYGVVIVSRTRLPTRPPRAADDCRDSPKSAHFLSLIFRTPHVASDWASSLAAPAGWLHR